MSDIVNTDNLTRYFMELSFGEQIKILLSRKNMTIQELADLYEQTTGSRMSRQNLAQRLKRDNFPEQDMRIFAALLGCNVSIQLTSAVNPSTFPDPSMIPSIPAVIPKPTPSVPFAIPEPALVASIPYGALEQTPVSSIPHDISEQAAHPSALTATVKQAAVPQISYTVSEQGPASLSFSAAAEQTAVSSVSSNISGQTMPSSGPADLMRTLQAPDFADYDALPAEEHHNFISEDRDQNPDLAFEIPEFFRKKKPHGEINPLTGQEYLTNTVRRHPYIDDYIQVYDRTTHSWSDVEEHYFWEFQQKKKQMMGSDYQEPMLI